ncbi:MAG: UPF0175 family protein [Bacteroidota bacterium]
MVAITEELLLATHVSEGEVRQDIGVLLYQKGLSLMKAADFAQMERLAFQYLLASKGVPVAFTVDDYEHDTAVLAARSRP